MRSAYLFLVSFSCFYPLLKAQNINIISDLTWKSSGTPTTGWNNINFNDSNWPNVYNPWVPWSPQSDQPNHKYSKDVILIWDPNSSNPAYMRKTFILNNLNMDSAFVWGTVDDDMDYYINGHQLFHDSNCYPSGFKSDVKDYLLLGENVLAAKGIDCGGYQWFCSELIIYHDSLDCHGNQNNLVKFTNTQNCPDGSINFFGSTVNTGYPIDIKSWQWDFGDGKTSIQQNPTHSFAAYGDYKVQLSVVSNNNCVDTTTQVLTIDPVCQRNTDFSIPDSVCVGQNFAIQNLSKGASTFHWNFCSGSLTNNPIGENMGNLGNLNKPVYSAIIKDGLNYFMFITNTMDGTISRLDFGNSLANQPVAVNLGDLGVLVSNIEGIQIKWDKSKGTWYGLVAGYSNNFIVRLNFGNSLLNVPTAENMGNIGNLMDRSHTLYTFEENNNWFTLVGNVRKNRLTLLSFGNSLANLPTAKDLGNVGNLNEPVGFYPIQDKGNWYLYIVNRADNSISRLDFGNSLTNQPTGVNLGNIGSVLNAPRSIVIIRDCGFDLGFIVNETTNDMVRISFPNGLTSQPTGESLGNIATFSFPHHFSQMFRDGDSIYCFITNVNNNTLSRIIFKGCSKASSPSSNLKDPPALSYVAPGVNTISLIVDEWLPTQANVCKQISVVVPNISVGPSVPEICEGKSVSLSATGASAYLWAPTEGLSSATGPVVSASPSITTNYTVVGSVLPGCSTSKTIEVKVNPKPVIDVVGTECVPKKNTYLIWLSSTGDKNIPGYGTITFQNGIYQVANVPNKFSDTIVSTISSTGCKDSLAVSAPSCPFAPINIPEGFSPNDDGINDYFVIPGIDAFPNAVLTVFTVYGQKVYEDRNYKNRWDGSSNITNNPWGRKLPTDTYYYILLLDSNNLLFKGFVYIGY